jgi:integrase
VDADCWVTDQVASMNRGEWIDPRDGKTTFGEYAATWQSAQLHRPSTTAQVDTNLRLHVLPSFERRPLSSVRTTEVQAWVRRLEADLAPATVRLIYGYLATIFKAAVRDRLISSSPCVEIKLPKPGRRQVVPLETTVVEALRAAVPARYRALVVLGAGSGVRQGEAFGLTVDRVDFPAPEAHDRSPARSAPGRTTEARPTQDGGE